VKVHRPGVPFLGILPGSPAGKYLAGLSGPESRPGILPGVPLSEVFAGLISPDPTNSTSVSITLEDGNPFPKNTDEIY
jgi:hypothetical protein